ncbi:MAG: hypothetical protein ABIJ05_00310 [Patescibacteria group bacterium]
MIKKDNLQPLDVSTIMFELLEKGECLSGNGIKYGNNVQTSEEDVIKFCKEHNNNNIKKNIETK